MAKSKKTLVSKLLLKRIAIIDREIGQKRYPNKERLADRLGVSTKTIQRDIDFLKSEYQAPIEFNKQRLGFYYTNSDFRMNPLNIDASDFLALAVTDKVLKQYKDTPYAKYFDNFYEKLSYIFDGKLSIDIKDLDNILSFYVGPVRKIKEGVMDNVERALKNNIRVNIFYRTGYSGTESERLIDIYHLKNHNGDWYMIGYCHKANQVKVFALSRIIKIKLTNQHYIVPDGFSIDIYFADSFGMFESKNIYKVKLKVMNESVRYITEREWHKSQKITYLKNGSIILEFTVNNYTEILFWALSMGSDCEVLQPKELRNIMISELSKALNNYK